MAGAAIALTILSTAMQAYSSIQQGKMEAAAQERSATINDMNADTAAFEAASNENTARRQLRQQLSRQLVSQGEAGITGNTFATQSYEQSVANGEADVLGIRYKGIAESQQYRNQAMLDRYGAVDSNNLGKMNAYVAIASGAADALSLGSKGGIFKPKIKPTTA